MDILAFIASLAAAGATFCLYVGFLYDFGPSPDLGKDTGGTSQRRSPRGDPWRRR